MLDSPPGPGGRALGGGPVVRGVPSVGSGCSGAPGVDGAPRFGLALWVGGK